MTAEYDEKEMQKRLDEELAHAKNMSSLIRKRKQGEVKPKELFFDAISDAQKELAEGLEFLQRAENNPALIFAESNRYFISTRGMVYTIMNHWKEQGDAIKGHDFQVYLADVANRYFQNWLRERNMTDGFVIQVRDANHFPSIFAIYHEDRELLQFNLIEKWYGVRKRPSSKEQLVEAHEKDSKRLDAAIQKQEEKVKEAIGKRDYPLQHFKGFKHAVHYLFVNKKKLYEVLDQAVKNEERMLLDLKEQKERGQLLFPKTVEAHQEMDVLIGQVEPFFETIDYPLQTEKNKLY